MIYRTNGNGGNDFETGIITRQNIAIGVYDIWTSKGTMVEVLVTLAMVAMSEIDLHLLQGCPVAGKILLNVDHLVVMEIKHEILRRHDGHDGHLGHLALEIFYMSSQHCV